MKFSDARRTGILDGKPAANRHLSRPKTMNLPLLLAAATPLSAKSTLTGLDWLAIALYFGILLGVAWWVVRRRKDTAADYFLAGRNLGWWVIGASIFASNIGSEHIVGLAGSGAKDGVAMAHYELHAWCLLVLAWVFVPFYARSLVFTMPEFLERRFSPALALRALDRVAGHVHRLEDRRGHLRRRRGLPHAAAGDALHMRRHRHQQLLDRLRPGDRADRPIHHARAACAPWPTTTPCRSSCSSSARRC